jgi:O-antigen/teichoic acid export membrane protein
MTEARNVDFGVTVSWGVIAQLTMAAVGFVGTILFARILGPAEFGGFYLLFALVKLADRPIAGVARAVKKRLSEASAPTAELFGAGLLMYVLTGAIGVAVVVLTEDLIVDYTGMPEAGIAFIALLLVLGLFVLSQNVFAATGLVGKPMWIDTLRSLLTFPAQLALVLLGLGSAGMAFGLVAATVLVLPITWWFIETPPTVPSRTQFKSIYEFARYSVPNSFLNKTFRQYDTLLLGFLISQGAAGQYEVAFKLTIPATFVAGAVGSGLMARVSNLATAGEEFMQDLINSLSFASIIAIPLFFGALAIPEAIVVTAYGAEYLPAASLLAGLALFQLFASQNRVLWAAIEGLDHPEWTMRVNTVIVVLNIITGYLLTLEYGIIGVVISTVATEFVRYLAYAGFLRSDFELELLPTALRRQLVAGVVMLGAVQGANYYVQVQSWYHLAILLCIGGLVYFGSLTLISPHFRDTAESITRSALG